MCASVLYISVLVLVISLSLLTACISSSLQARRYTVLNAFSLARTGGGTHASGSVNQWFETVSGFINEFRNETESI